VRGNCVIVGPLRGRVLEEEWIPYLCHLGVAIIVTGSLWFLLLKHKGILQLFEDENWVLGTDVVLDWGII